MRKEREVVRLKTVTRRCENNIVSENTSATRSRNDICDVVVGPPMGLAGCDPFKMPGSTWQGCMFLSDESDRADRLAQELLLFAVRWRKSSSAFSMHTNRMRL